MQIRGSTQIISASITADRLVGTFNLSTAQLAEGALFLKTDGTKTMTAALNMGTNKITNLVDPTSAQDAATRNYVDALGVTVSSTYLKKDGSVALTGSLSAGGFNITNAADPVNPQDVATKNYVDLAAQGLSAKYPVRVATTANITLSGTQTIDTIALSAGDRVLVKNQTTASGNGIYVVAAGAWARSTDADLATELKGGTFVFVQEGATLSDTGWVISTDGAIVLGTTSINWIQFSSAGVILAGNGIVKVGNTLSVQLQTNSGLVVDGTGVGLQLDGATLSKSATGVKLADPGAANFYLGNASGAAVPVTMSGGATISNTGVVSLVGVLAASNFISGEVPTGTVNGSNSTFNLAFSPSAGKETVYLNGVRQARTSDYTISGAVITFVSAPLTGDSVLVDYLK